MFLSEPPPDLNLLGLLFLVWNKLRILLLSLLAGVVFSLLTITGASVGRRGRLSPALVAATNPGSLTRLLLGGPSRSEMQVVESGQLQIFRTGSNIRVPDIRCKEVRW